MYCQMFESVSGATLEFIRKFICAAITQHFFVLVYYICPPYKSLVVMGSSRKQTLNEMARYNFDLQIRRHSLELWTDALKEV